MAQLTFPASSHKVMDNLISRLGTQSRCPKHATADVAAVYFLPRVYQHTRFTDLVPDLPNFKELMKNQVGRMLMWIGSGNNKFVPISFSEVKDVDMENDTNNHLYHLTVRVADSAPRQKLYTQQARPTDWKPFAISQKDFSLFEIDHSPSMDELLRDVGYVGLRELSAFARDVTANPAKDTLNIIEKLSAHPERAALARQCTLELIHMSSRTTLSLITSYQNSRKGACSLFYRSDEYCGLGTGLPLLPADDLVEGGEY